MEGKGRWGRSRTAAINDRENVEVELVGDEEHMGSD